MGTSIALFTGIMIIVLGFLAEYMDSSLGMGYGTSLTPILMIMGFEPLQIVPAILLSELITGILAGILHSRVGNTKFSIELNREQNVATAVKTGRIISLIRNSVSRDLKVVCVISVFSIIGALASVSLALSISKFALKTYIGILVVVIGVVLILTARKNFSFSWKRIIMLSVIASFNKGMSGGGYGPVVTGGQMLSGVDNKSAIGITSLSEGLTCAAGLLLYFLFPEKLDFTLFPYLIAGAILSVPLSVMTVKKVNSDNLRYVIGGFTILLGSFTLIKLFI